MKKKSSPPLGALILAAGMSSRMGAFKPLLKVGEETALLRIINRIKAAGIEDIVLVTGYERQRLLPLIEGKGIKEVYNESYRQGMFESVKAGLEACAEIFAEDTAFFLLPVDCPLVSEEVMDTLIDEHLRHGEEKNFLVPVYEGKKGHPLLIPREYIGEICSWEGEGGLKGITDRYYERMKRIPVEDEGCLLDMDTPEGYREIKDFLEGGGKREELAELAAGRRIFLIRHGETRQHREKIFLGQYDVPLSGLGRDQAKKSALELEGENIKTGKIYSSDLSRCLETAEIIREVLQKNRAVEIVKEKAFREINLGSWDGKAISLVKREFPEDYHRRGKDIFAFKKGNGSENFYDVQYRAVKALRRILKNDSSEDILLVIHSGVARALENNLRGRRVNDYWEGLPKGTWRKVEIKK